MFFCEPCRVKNGWPESLMKSHGTCEICGEVKVCFDIPSRLLPIPGKTMEETREIEAEIDRNYQKLLAEKLAEGKDQS